MKFALALVCLIALWSLACGQMARVYCGRRLAQTLAVLCSEIEEEGAVKRSEGALSGAAMYGTRGWRWAARGAARGKRGVVEECCDQPCTLDTLFSYC
ncbi:bombyxin-related peptide B-like [Manduca sexta]|uniref:bombyxin-related peptide B-like n=1 Tax=Manduca sexta TaxID=7130 RepID=UPI00188DEE7C|nr:bombyxin-related peptide B-like [Manduca sexta]